MSCKLKIRLEKETKNNKLTSFTKVQYSVNHLAMILYQR